MKTLRLFCFLALATATLGLTACSDDGDGGEVDAPPANNPPVAAFTMTPDCTVDQTTVITFASTSTDPDGDELTCSWTFTSGTPDASTECTQDVTFPSVAPYDVTLTVSDPLGGQASTSMQIAPCP